MTSWLPVAPGSDFPIQNIPFGIFKPKSSVSARAGSIIGNQVIDLAALYSLGHLDGLGLSKGVLESTFLNDFIALGKLVTRATRERIQQIFSDAKFNTAELKDAVLFDEQEVEMLLPVKIGDYTDFYSSREHATNVGIMFRDPANALLPNWLHIPVGYHGRSSSIVVSGTPIRRPKGQTNPKDEPQPLFGPSLQVDFELEMAFVVGKSNALGEPVSVENAEEHIFGLALFNDWSARDIQKWEYVPLGPFLAKNFASSLAPWIVTMEALEPFRCEGPVQENPAPLPYLQTSGKNNIDLNLEVDITPEGVAGTTVSKSNFKYMYWSMAQQLAHHTINGCNMQVGDVCASGTISGPTPSSYGSMLELAWRGTKPLPMADGTERKFIQDGDTVTMRGYCEREGLRIGFGKVEGKVMPA